MRPTAHPPRLKALTLAAAATLALAGCSAAGAADPTGSAAAATASSSAPGGASTQAGPAGVVGGATVTDMSGAEVTIPEDVDSVIATDNRSFRTLDEWDVTLTAAPKQIMYRGETGPSYRTDESVADIGSHREPDMEVFVTAEPDVVINGQRFDERKAEIDELTGDAAVVDTTIPEGTRVDEGLKRLTAVLGQATGHTAEAERLNADFDAAIARAKDAYDPEDTVMGIIASGGKLSYVAPSTGRSIGPMFDILGLTPALDQAGSTNHQGDDISVEAIAQADPDWIIVMDRDAALDEAGATAQELIAASPALQDVTAVKEGHIVHLPQDFYLSEDIQNYTAVMEDLADAFDAAS